MGAGGSCGRRSTATVRRVTADPATSAAVPTRRTELARWWWAVTAVVVTASLVGELVNILRGVTAVDDAPTPVRVLRFFSFFTVESNILVAVTSVLLWRRPDRDERWFRWLRLAALVGITITGVVYATLLAPVHDPEGSAAVTNVGVHYVAPIATVVGCVLVGPRPRTDWRLVVQVLAWPVAWVLWTFLHGRIGWNHWYPYPFLDVRDLGYTRAILNCVGVAALMLAVASLYRWLDGRLRPAP